tara:strand:+ start:8838 stop:9539 length:702 start_codon:yes stop_codon:yes gene_type:complete
MIKSIPRILYISMIALLFSCGGSGSGEEQPPEPQPKNDLPAMAVGTLPVNGEPCSDYTEVSTDESKVSIAFNWNSAQFADNYELVVKEDNSEVFKNSFIGLEAQVELERGKTYTWTVNSINEFGRTSGNTYSFTTPGTPIGNYAPYAAEISIGFNASTMQMSISWIGGDEDNDDLVYDIKVWKNEDIILEETDFTSNALDAVLFTGEQRYTVEVTSKDTAGNFSISTYSVQAP